MSGRGSSALTAATARPRCAAVSISRETHLPSAVTPTGARNSRPGAMICGSESWAMIKGRCSPSALMISRTRSLAAEHEHALLGEKIGEAAARIERQGLPMAIERHAALDTGADLLDQHDK